MDFLEIKEEYYPRKKVINIVPTFKVIKSKDLMIRGNQFYAIFDEKTGFWSTDQYDVARMIDEALYSYKEEAERKMDGITEIKYVVKTATDYSTNVWDQFVNYCKKSANNFHPLDSKIWFDGEKPTKKDYVSKKLCYSLSTGDCPAYKKLMSVLYSPEEREKLEWAIGSVVAGDSIKLQKFIVLYGEPGTGKSTVLDIIQKMFDGYTSIFEAKSLVSRNNAFGTELFKDNPLIAIQHDGDLSRIEDNTTLNSIISHEAITINEKHKSQYTLKLNSFLFMGTNKPVKITDSKAGIIRRLIDVRPTGNRLEPDLYFELTDKIDFELGAIANHCLQVYEKLGKSYYNGYKPLDMMYKTDPFFNFVEDSYPLLSKEEGVTLGQAYTIYKNYCQETNENIVLKRFIFREELKDYFEEFCERGRDANGNQVRNWYHGFKFDKFEQKQLKAAGVNVKKHNWLDFIEQPSIFDEVAKDYPAQLTYANGNPKAKWEDVKTTLKDIDTSKLHYVKVPIEHIVIDFDIKDEDGNKSLEKNLAAASSWPETYAELSKSGSGIHLHYLYSGDVEMLSRVFDDNIEVKVFNGNSSLRRKLTKCNNLPISSISSGLPLKKGEKMISFANVKDERHLRIMIKKNLRKEFHPNTKPSVDFIFKLLEDAYNDGMHYDVSDMYNAILGFASSSHNQADACIKTVMKMHFKSEEDVPNVENEDSDDNIIFYDVEVFPNLFLINWKYKGEGKPIVRMINPSPVEVEDLVKHKLVGFNCRRYDNHILYARIMGYSNLQLFNLSQRIIKAQKGEKNNGLFGGAYNLSYTDIYDYSTDKKSLKKWEILLKLHHQELGLPWDKPVPEERWVEVAEYCDNDVISTEAVWNATQADFRARQILVSIAQHAGCDACVNDTTNSLTTKIIFGKVKNPDLVYTDLTTGKTTPEEYERKDIITAFPDYRFVKDEKGCMHNMYKNIDLGFGGWVYSDPGMYGNVALLDIASMHPHSIIAMECFGEYTQRFKELVQARIAIKHKDFEEARTMLDGALAPFLGNEELADQLSKALKIPINSVYGLTSAKFDNPFKDNRNLNNIVALRGALFMATLKEEVEKRGFVVAHIKTDSIKIPDATPEIINFCMEFAKEYGYEFEHEATYEKMCLVNDACYIAQYKSPEDCERLYGYVPGDNKKHNCEWTATAAEFQHPYIFKTLFSHEPIEFDDYCEIKEVKSSIYLDMNYGYPDYSLELKRLNKELKYYEDMKMGAGVEETMKQIKHIEEESHNYIFVGRIGEFVPVVEGGGILVREQDGKMNAVTGTKGYRWIESENAKGNPNYKINLEYYRGLVDNALDDLAKYGNPEWFCSDAKYDGNIPFVGGKVAAA